MSSSTRPPGDAEGVTPEAQAAVAAAAAAQDGTEAQGPSTSSHTGGTHHHPDYHARHHGGDCPHLDQVPPPAYNGAEYGQLAISQNGLDTGATLARDGRVNIKINQRSHKLTNLLIPALRKQLELQTKKEATEAPVPAGLRDTDGLPPPPMNIVIQIVGSRGDVQPFVALGQVLKNRYHHRVRIATHAVFKDFVTANGLEFFSIGGDPAELMAFMVKNPGLMPGMDSLRSGDVGKRRKGIYEIINGCWRSCIEAGDGMGPPGPDDTRSFDSTVSLSVDPTLKPFVADAIIANPPSFAHVHIAEKLGVPLHLMFTMPWSPTQHFPHPLANIISSNTDPNMANFVTYALVDMLTWQGLGDVINRFRERVLGLEPVSIMWAPGMISRLRIPWTYCWSPALIPKPDDWGRYIDVSGFYFLNLATNYHPAQDLADFLAAGPPPVYIGFGSIVVDDPNAMTRMIFEAVKKTGQRALVSKGWGGLGADEMGIPPGVFMLGNCPHDWLFQRVSCVVHHGGAGTTAAGILAGRPTVVVPFFGDQPFWGSMTARAGAGPLPVPYKHLTADKLAASIMEALKPESLERAQELSAKIRAEDGTDAGAKSFHNHLHLPDMRCALDPRRTAAWRVRRTDIRLSPFAATVLGTEGLLDFSELKLYRPREYETEHGPWDPISGGAAALLGTIGNLSMGMADFPVEILRSLKIASGDLKDIHERRKAASGTTTPTTTSRSTSPHDSVARTGASSPLTSPEATASTPTFSTPATSTQSTSTMSTVAKSAMSTVMSADGRPCSRARNRCWSPHRSHSDGSPASRGRADRIACEEVGQVSLETALSGAKAMGKIVSAGIKSPMDFTLSLAQGFHNAPKLYGDDTVRKSEKVVDLQSGLKAAGKEFGYGFYDGITGLVTQPISGARKEGPAGFIKGAAKGVGGLILKPGAAIWGLPGYTAKGIYAEVAKHFGSSVENYIIAARTAQGFEDWKNSTAEERARVVDAWKDSKLEGRKGGQLYGKERKDEMESHIISRTKSNSAQLVHGFKNTRHLSWDERKVLAERKAQLKREEKELIKREKTIQKSERNHGISRWKHGHSSSTSMVRPVGDVPAPEAEFFLRSSQTFADEDDPLSTYEQVIQSSIMATSRGNPDDDAVIERALRASLRELHGANLQKSCEDEAYMSAIKASMDEFKKAQAEKAPKPDGISAEQEREHDEALQRVLTQSLEEYKLAQASRASSDEFTTGSGHDDSHSEVDTDYDEHFKDVIKESTRLHAENEQKRKDLAQREAALSTVAGSSDAASPSSPQALRDDDDEEELKRTITASEEEAKAHQERLTKQQTEEQIVLDYVKKQSLLEEELGKSHTRANVQAETGPDANTVDYDH